MSALADAQLSGAIAAHQVGAGRIFELELHDLTILHASRKFTAATVADQGRRLMAAARVRVALPWLQAALAEAAANETQPVMSALRWLGGRGQLVPGELRDWREWLLEPIGGASLLARWPAAPTMALESGLSAPGPCSWCLAQPVHLAAGLDHLRLAPLAQAAVSAEEASALGAHLAAHFPADELSVAAFVHGAWLLRLAGSIDCSTRAPDLVVGHDVHDFMPAGRDGPRIRSLMNEIQMLLHDHPVNQRRERARQLPVNSWWLWGIGEAAPGTAPIDGEDGWSLHGDDRWLHALWRVRGRDAGSSPTLADDPLQGDAFVALSQPPAGPLADALASVDTGLLSMLVSSVRAGALGSLDLLAGSTTLRIDSRARLRFWRRPCDLSRWLA
jgi:hypothetical protein